MPSKLKLPLGRRSAADVVGLDIQPGFIAAVKAQSNGSLRAMRAAALPLPSDTVREGEVTDDEALSSALRELFDGSGLSRRVRIGVANQRTVMRTLELPPMADRKELAAAVNFQAQDQVPMPLANAVLDFHPLEVIETPEGPRQRVVLVAAQRDMIERLIAAVRAAGLQPVGVDLSAFALIRSLYRAHPEAQQQAADASEEQLARVLYLNVDGLTNLAIARGPVCSFTRVVGSGLEGMASELAERRGIPVTDARALIAALDLDATSASEPHPTSDEPAESHEGDPASGEGQAPDDEASAAAAEGEPETEPDASAPQELDSSYSELLPDEDPYAAEVPISDADVRAVVENGIREISGEVRNSLDFHRAQGAGGDVSHVALSGAVLDMPGFAEALQLALNVEVRSASVAQAETGIGGEVSVHRLAVAAGLATVEVSQ